MSILTENIVKHILENEHFPTRFEDLCVRLFSEVDQVTYVKTSQTYDLGRDGKSVSNKKIPSFICCGIGNDPVSKAELDLTRIVKFVSPRDVLCCFNDPSFTEHKANAIEAKARLICPDLEIVRSFGSDQLSQLIVELYWFSGKWTLAGLG